MNVTLAKERLVSLKKKAEKVVGMAGLKGQKAQVVNVMDISGSMQDYFRTGLVQSIFERSLALGVQFDDDGEIPVYLFGRNHYKAGLLTEDDFDGYANREILQKYQLEGDTRYAGVLIEIIKDHFPEVVEVSGAKKGGLFRKAKPGTTVLKKLSTPLALQGKDPLFVQFITDGDNSDRESAEQVIRIASYLPMFIQFVGIGNASFKFLHDMDDMSGRFIDNAGFFHGKSPDEISDEKLMKEMLNEFPEWLQQARIKGLV